ncbi:hypothetical protein ACIQMR_35185 [Streptomyces sp. NPDC091376]|uniref:hypothetical protein n=1 Tax=Streptomyces sp. NPDC091376 TaxID=3365994 RepID=UPI00381F9E57
MSVVTNLLPANTSGIETDTSGWTAGGNTSLDKATRFYQGAASLGLTATSTGTVSATTAARVAVTAGTEYQCYAYFANRSVAVAGRAATVRVDWYAASSGGSAISSVTSTAGTIPNSTNFLTPPPQLVAVAPAGANYASVTIAVTSVAGGAGNGVVADVISFGVPDAVVGNLISYETSSSESGLVGWSAVSNCAVAASSAQSWEGWRSLQVTATASGDAKARTTASYPVTAGTEYFAYAWTFAPVAATMITDIEWLDASSAVISTSSQSMAAPATTWARLGCIDYAPAGAVTARVVLRPQATASSQVWLFDWIALRLNFLIEGNSIRYRAQSFETTVSDWTAVQGCTIARSTARSFDGTASMLITADGATNPIVRLVDRIPVIPRRPYRLEPVFWHDGSTGVCVVDLLYTWYDGEDVAISSNYFRWTTGSGVGWYTLRGSGVAPLGAATVSVGVRVQSASTAGRTYHLDFIFMAQGGLAIFADAIPGQYAATVTLEGLTQGGYSYYDLKRMLSDGSMVPVRGPSGDIVQAPITGAIAVIEDHEAPLGESLKYYIRLHTPPSTGYTAQTSNPVTLPQPPELEVVLKDPTLPARMTTAVVKNIPDWQRSARQAVHQVHGRELPIVISDARSGRTGTLALVTETREERDRLVWLLKPGNPILIQWPEGWDEDAMYVAVGDLPEKRLARYAGFTDRDWELPLIEVDRPAGGIVGSAGTTWGTVDGDNEDWMSVFSGSASWLGVLVGTDA